MTNENAIFEISRIKFRKDSQVLPIPLYQKTKRIIFMSLKTLKVYQSKPETFYQIKNVFKNGLVLLKKMLICLFWLFLGSKFPSIELPSTLS